MLTYHVRMKLFIPLVYTFISDISFQLSGYSSIFFQFFTDMHVEQHSNETVNFQKCPKFTTQQRLQIDPSEFPFPLRHFVQILQSVEIHCFQH